MREDAARPRACPVLDTGVIRWGNRLRGSGYEGSGWPTTSSEASAWRKTQLAQGAERHGEAARHEAASLLGTADRRMSKVRPSCQSAMPQGMRSRSKRQTHFDRLMEDEAQCALRPWRPTDEAINPKRRTIAQRKERSTPTARPVSSDGSDQLPTTGRVSSGRRAYHSNRRTWTEDEGPASPPSFRPALLAKDQRQPRFSSIPSWETGGERIILRSCPCNRDHAPRVSMVGNLGKSQTVRLVSPLRDPQKRACDAPFANCRQIVH